MRSEGPAAGAQVARDYLIDERFAVRQHADAVQYNRRKASCVGVTVVHTVTFNPAFDLTYRVSEFKFEDKKLRTRVVFCSPGGVNVS